MSNIVYHYTNIDTLYNLLNNIEIIDQEQHGLLMSQIHNWEREGEKKVDELALEVYENCRLTFWLSHINYLNDPSEYVHIFGMLKDFMKRFEESNHLQSKAEALCNALNKWLLDASSLFVFSLSKLEDSLLMWRGYGEDGYGVALGFDADEIGARRCIYGGEEVYRKMEEELDPKEIYDTFSYTQDSTVFLASVLSRINQLCASVKNPAYSEEKEFRVVMEPPYEINCMKYRCRAGDIIPYIEYKVPLSLLKRITIGPCAEPERVKASLTSMIWNKFGFFPMLLTDIDSSQVPYVSRRKR